MEIESLKKLKISQNFISIFASGHSVSTISKEEIEEIKAKSFMITMNYAPPYLKGHANIFADKRVFLFLQDYYKNNKKECILIGNARRFNKGTEYLQQIIDYSFDIRKEGLRGSYTIVWLLQLMQLYFSEKTILLFGLDLYNENGNGNVCSKWYDLFTKFDSDARKKNYDVIHKIHQSGEQIRRLVKNNNIYNCNLKSHLDYFPKKEWKEILI